MKVNLSVQLSAQASPAGKPERNALDRSISFSVTAAEDERLIKRHNGGAGVTAAHLVQILKDAKKSPAELHQFSTFLSTLFLFRKATFSDYELPDDALQQIIDIDRLG